MNAPKKPVSLKFLAEHLGLSPTTVSLVLNDSAHANSIPQHTRDRVLEAARDFNYRPNFFARYLTSKRSYTAAVIVPEISDGYGASIIGAIERRMTREKFFHFVVSHSWSAELIEEMPRLLMQRGVEGFVVCNMPLQHSLPVPVVNIGGHKPLDNVTNILLDNRKAGRLAMEHLAALGHRQIAFFKGHPGSADTEDRWEGIHEAATALGIEIDPDLTVQLRRKSSFPPEPPTPEEGAQHARKLLSKKKPFTALFAFNDIAAIGAMRVFRNAGLRVPEDVSIIGFDDIEAAGFLNPPLTTIRQPLEHMGDLAAKILLRRIADPNGASGPEEILVEPELIVRGSTAPPPKKPR